ncbi:MAG: flippase-like domain-containing protein [Deltaproteobacteria bacterium]|nr:flippase-like domain-containing protein [Deltaproteobacteria bacterium]MCX7952752.1 flippase-like domain-containing protein [Deltaproteobacteria bacterium]
MKTLIGFILFVGSILFLLTIVDFEQVVSNFSDIRLSYAFISGLSLFVHFCLRAERLQIISGMTFRQDSYGIIFLSNFANMILPLRLGEVVKIGLIKIFFSKSLSTSTFIVIFERALDLFIVFCLGLVLVSVYSFELSNFKFQIITFGAISVGVILLVCLLRNTYTQNTFLKKFFNLTNFDVSALNQTNGLRVIIFSFLIWAFTAFFHYACCLSFGVEVNVSHALIITLLNSLFISVPSSPGFIGPYQASFVLAGKIIGLDANKAMSISILSHLINYLLLTPASVYFLCKTKMNLTDINSLTKISKLKQSRDCQE